MRSRHIEEELEDITGQTGWMYTDLFVGLMVIFLATITFIPAGHIFVDKTAVQTYAELYKTPLAMRYSNFNSKQIINDVEAFAAKQGITNGAKVLKLRIVGSYDPKSETPDQGIARAVAFSQSLSAISSEWFTDATTTLQSAADAQTNNVVVEYTFSRLIQVLPTP